MPRAEGDPPSSTTSPASMVVPTPSCSASPAQVVIQAPVYSPVRLPAQIPNQIPNQISTQSPTHNNFPVVPIKKSQLIRPPLIPGVDVPAELGQWQPLFEGTQPTQMMADLLTAIFICLDATGTRLLAPEQYSSFLEVQGYLLEEDVCEFSLTTNLT